MQLTIQAVSALKPSTFGDFADIELKMLISTKNNVTNNVMRPGITSGGITKLVCKKETQNENFRVYNGISFNVGV